MVSEDFFVFAVLISIFQLNVTLGILYIGLPEFRFRMGLYDVVIDRINHYRFFEIYEGKTDLGQLLASDGAFSERLNEVQDWVIELPPEYLEKLPPRINQHIRNYKPSEKKRDRCLWSLYKWFANGRDKVLIWILTLVIAFVAIWGRALFPDLLKDYNSIVQIIAGIGFLNIILHLIFGFILPSSFQKKFNASIEYVMNEIKIKEEPKPFDFLESLDERYLETTHKDENDDDSRRSR